MSQFWFIQPVSSNLVVQDLGNLVAQDLGDFHLGSSTMEEMQDIACHADMAGHAVTMVAVERRFHGPIYRLFVSP